MSEMRRQGNELAVHTERLGQLLGPPRFARCRWPDEQDGRQSEFPTVTMGKRQLPKDEERRLTNIRGIYQQLLNAADQSRCYPNDVAIWPHRLKLLEV